MKKYFLKIICYFLLFNCQLCLNAGDELKYEFNLRNDQQINEETQLPIIAGLIMGARNNFRRHSSARIEDGTPLYRKENISNGICYSSYPKLFEQQKLCYCDTGFILKPGYREICETICDDSKCSQFSKCNNKTNKCDACDNGYIFEYYRCVPVCNRMVDNAKCVAPDKFDCNFDYIKSLDFKFNIICDGAWTFTSKILAIPALVIIGMLITLIVLIVRERRMIYNIRKQELALARSDNVEIQPAVPNQYVLI